jgi:signal peptidase
MRARHLHAVGRPEATPARPHLTLVPEPVATGPLRAAFRSTNRAAVSALSVLLVLGWFWFLLPQSLGGRAGWVLVDGTSMLPRYHTGDLVLVRSEARYHVGQVIAYRVPKGRVGAGAQVIHRIVGGDATHGFVMQGDNRTAPDVWHPRQGDIVGAKVLRIPYAIVLLQFLRSPVLLGLLAAAFVFVKVLSSGERTRDDDAERDAGDA